MRQEIIAFTALCLALAGCAELESKITTYQHMPETYAGTKIAVRPARPEREGSLEFAAFQKIIEQHLAEKGFVIVANPQDATWVALLDYSIDSGRTTTSTSSTPIYGATGGGLQTTTVMVPTSTGSRPVSTTGFAPITYGVVGVDTHTSSSTLYRRVLTLDILDKPAPSGAVPRKLYEAKLLSSGECQVLAEVFPELAVTLFKNWPGNDGQTVTVTVPSHAKC